MNNHQFFIPRLLIFSLFAFIISTTVAVGQTIVPDEQIKAEMIAFVAKMGNAREIERPRIVNKLNSVEKAESKQSQRISKIESSSANFSIERKAFEILNEQRIAKGLEPLRWNEEMAQVARLHSENMAQYKFFSHTGLDGSLVNDRADALGISDWSSIGENIAFNKGFKKPVESACQQWMNSPSHRENILNKRWKESAIGAAIAPDGTYYFTQVFVLK
jgi:uncharacterized protein YkwD